MPYFRIVQLAKKLSKIRTGFYSNKTLNLRYTIDGCNGVGVSFKVNLDNEPIITKANLYERMVRLCLDVITRM